MRTECGRGRYEPADVRRRLPGIAAAILCTALASPMVQADGAASKNRNGNKLFAEGRYGDAEVAYREAQRADPDRPELHYNLGNALLKGRDLEAALRELRAAASYGEPALRARAWYNTGNALFEVQRFKEAVDAYAQSLRIDPTDGDAKHNLELALQQQKQQKEQQGPSQSQDQQQNEDEKRNEKDPGKSGDQASKPRPDGKSQPPPDDKDQNRPANPQATSAEEAAGTFSKERALQILDALKNQELVEQRKLLEARARRKSAGRDW